MIPLLIPDPDHEVKPYDWRDTDWDREPVPGPFRWGFRRETREPLTVMMVKADMSLVRMSRCYHELTELHYDNARRVNFVASRALSCDIDATYHTALMGGEPYSDWN